MAEVLIRVVDKVHPTDAVLDRQLTKFGDVIHVAPDGWPWGSEELINPEWRIVKIPTLDPALVLDMMEPEYTAPDAQGNKILIRKKKKFYNINNLNTATKNKILSSGQVITLTLTQYNSLVGVKEVKPSLGQIKI